MMFDELVEALQSIGLPLAYDHFAEGDSPAPPFLIFLFPRTDHFIADDSVYQKITEVDIELYSDYKDPELERRVEAALDSRGIVYERSETWIPEEKLYEILYECEELM